MRFLAAFVVISGILFFNGTPVLADDTFDVSVSPSYFQPFSSVVLTPTSGAFSLDAAAITITADGQNVFKGSGAESVPVTLGGAGKTTNIVVSAVVNGTTYTKALALTPQDVSLVLEPSTTVHPLYRGGNVISPESPARLVALANFRDGKGNRLDPTTLVYSWRVGEQALAAQSGIGKSVLSVQAPVRYRDAIVSVTITTQDQTLIGGASIHIAPGEPLVRIYRNDPLLGPDFNNALAGTFGMTDTEDTFRVVPYFFSKLPTLSWTVNSVISGSEQDLTVRPTGTGPGSATLGVSATDSALLQQASQNLSVTFGAAKPLGIFGL